MKSMGSKRGNYAMYTGDNKVKVDKFAADNGITKGPREAMIL